MTAPSIVIVGIGRADDNFVIYLPDHQEIVCRTEADLGREIAKVYADAPKAEHVVPNAEKVRGAAVKVAKKTMPGYDELAEPAVDTLTALSRFIVKKITALKNAAPPASPPPPPQPKRRLIMPNRRPRPEQR